MKKSITKEPDPVRTKRVEIEISLTTIYKERMEGTLDLIEGLAESGQIIAEGAHELGFQVQNQIGEIPPGATALPGLATAMYDLFERIDKNLNRLKKDIEMVLETTKEAAA